MSRLSEYKPPVVVGRLPEKINCVGVCTVCKRRHDNIGFQYTRNHPIKWFCLEDAEHIKAISTMPKKLFDMYESDSIMEGGAKAGQYLDTIGVTDLAELTEDQFRAFFVKFLGGYEDAMKSAMQRVDNA